MPAGLPGEEHALLPELYQGGVPHAQCGDLLAKGCEHSCAYVRFACDLDGKKTEPCNFPFTYKGEELSECTTKSPYGEVQRPWCYVGDAKSKQVGFCDCTEIQCVCPPGSHLKKDGVSCT